MLLDLFVVDKLIVLQCDERKLNYFTNSANFAEEHVRVVYKSSI